MTLTEEWEKRDVVPTPAELADKKVYDWQRFQPQTKSVRCGKLRIQMSTGGAHWDRPAWWADRQRWNIEDKLDEVLAEITCRAQAEQDRIAAEEQAKLQRQRDWEAAMANAGRRTAGRARSDELARVHVAGRAGHTGAATSDTDDGHDDETKAIVRADVRRHMDSLLGQARESRTSARTNPPAVYPQS